MQTPESKIREVVFHPEEELRLTALAYFARSHTEDESIMPLVIEAVEKYGRDKAFRILRDADSLPQTEATVRWLVDELSKDWDLGDVTHDNYCCAVALILCQARTDLLRPDMADLRCFPEELRDWFRERLEMASWEWDTGWPTLLPGAGQGLMAGKPVRGVLTDRANVDDSWTKHTNRRSFWGHFGGRTGNSEAVSIQFKQSVASS